MKRGLAIVIVGVVVLVCIAIIVVYSSIGPVIVATIEEFGEKIGGTKVTLSDAEYSPTTGEATFTNLVVGSPAGFTSKNAFTFSGIELQIDPETLQNEVIVIKRMKIDAPEIIYEISETSDNLRTLRSNIEYAVQQEQQPVTGESRKAPLKKFVINDLYFTTGVVVVRSADMRGKRVTAVLDPLHIKDIGREENGLYPAALIERIYGPLLRATTIAALSTDLSLSDQARNLLEGAVDETDGALNKLKKLFKD